MKVRKGRLTKIGTVESMLADISEEHETIYGHFISMPKVGKSFIFYVTKTEGGDIEDRMLTSKVRSASVDDNPGCFLTKNSVYRIEDLGEA